MRTLFLLLLAANVLYAGWALFGPAAPAGATAVARVAPRYPVRLELAGEYRPAAPSPAGAPAHPAPPSPATDLSVTAPPAQETAVAGSSGGVPDAVGAGAADASASGFAGDPGAALATADAPAPETQAAPPPARCVQVGPFPDEARARAALERVRAWLPEAGLATVAVPGRSSFWVHVPPRSSEDEARAVVARLAASGIESFVIRDEPALRNAVSLGVFRDAASAGRHAARFAGIGYPVAVHEAARERSGVVVTGALAADPQGLEAALGAEAAIEELACPVVAEPGAPD